MMKTEQQEALDIEIDRIINDVGAKLTSIQPEKLSEYIVKLSVYLSNLADQIGDAQEEYARTWLNYRSTHSLQEAAMWTDQCGVGGKKKRLEKRFEAVVELIQSLKKRVMVLKKENDHSW
jgi:hypothetical protein